MQRTMLNMTGKLLLHAGVMIIGIIPLCRAQVDPTNLDKKLLEHEIKILIDSTRIANQLPRLFNDSILYIAYEHHAEYLVSKAVLSHEEQERPFLTPQDRASYYGAPKSYFVGENIAWTPFNASVKVKDKTFLTTDYQAIARSLVYSWVNSKGHFKNIIDPNYQITGLAIAVDPKLRRIYACQKFAYVLYTYSFSESKEFFPYSNRDLDSALTTKKYVNLPYPHGLKDDKPEKCNECKKVWEAYPPMSVRVAKDYFILRVENDDFVKALIQNKHDGFAIELVPFDAFACGNPAYELEPSRRNEQKRTSGQLLVPVYRKDLMKGFKKRKKVKNLSFVKYIFTADSISFFKRFGGYELANFDADYFEIKLGKVPKGMSGWWNHNLVYIHDKQICHVVYFTSYPGELSTELVDVDYRPPVPVNNYDFQLERFADTLELFYSSGQTISSDQALIALITQLKQEHLTIESIRIQGFCSVEGDSLTNELLHRQRAENILDRLKVLTDSSTQSFIQSQVAWDHFYRSVKQHPKWGFLYALSRKEVSKYLSNPKNEKPTEILSRERKVNVEITAIKRLSPQTALYYIQRDIRNLVYKDKRGDFRCRDEASLQLLYERAYYLSTVDTLDVGDFLNIEIPKMAGLLPHPLQQDLLFYRYHYLRGTSDEAVLGSLETNIETLFNSCGLAMYLSPEFHYLSACLLVKRMKALGAKTKPDDLDIQITLDRLNLLLNNYKDSSFFLDVSRANLNVISILCMRIDPEQVYKYTDIVNSSLIQIVEYYRNTGEMDPQSAVRIAKLCCYFRNIPLAIDICSEFLYDNEVLKLYLPLAFMHSSYLTGNEELAFEIEFHQLLLEARTRLTPSEWCQLFYGKYGIPFQVMDNERLHAEFCATCPDRVNELLKEE